MSGQVSIALYICSWAKGFFWGMQIGQFCIQCGFPFNKAQQANDGSLGILSTFSTPMIFLKKIVHFWHLIKQVTDHPSDHPTDGHTLI